MNEFTLIDDYFKSFPTQRNELVFGIGDDAASLNIPNGNELLVSMDTLVSGVHFLPEWDAYDIASRAVMVNLSDMAAMAAEPMAVTLALTIPDSKDEWLNGFSRGLFDSLKRHRVDLIGGDTTKGPLSITLTVLGRVPQGKSVRRNGAKPGDVIFVSGYLGAAALAVSCLKNPNIVGSSEDEQELMSKLVHPKPRLDLIPFLRSFASSAIDISDGLSADLNHICVASGVGACLNPDSIPIHPLVLNYLGKEAVDLVLTGGDDYELCFTVPAETVASFTADLSQFGIVCHPIGVIEEQPGLRLKINTQNHTSFSPRGYSHF